MSYDINFWKQERPLDLSAQQIYERLSRQEPVEGLAKLPVETILGELREAFPTFDPTEKFPLVSLDEGSIEFFWSDQFFRFDLRGEIGAAHENKLVTIMAEHGCPMYDPQLGRRYDAANGTALGDRPQFEDPSPERKAELERLKQQFTARLDGMSTKNKGCARPAAILLGVLAVVVAIAFRAIG